MTVELDLMSSDDGPGHLSRLSKSMPFKSQAQRRKFAQLLVEGKISNQTFEEWNREHGRLADREPLRNGDAR
jgi:hypothetical protein